MHTNFYASFVECLLHIFEFISVHLEKFNFQKLQSHSQDFYHLLSSVRSLDVILNGKKCEKFITNEVVFVQTLFPLKTPNEWWRRHYCQTKIWMTKNHFLFSQTVAFIGN